MKLKLLDTIVLRKNIPKYNLYSGDMGTIVEVYAPKVFEVEFICADGHTQSLQTLNQDDIRPISGSDVLSVRSLNEAA